MGSLPGAAGEPAGDSQSWPESSQGSPAAKPGSLRALQPAASVQTPKNYPTSYREDSYLRGYHDCPFAGQSIQSEKLDQQVAALIQSVRLPATWEQDVRKLLRDEMEGPDPEEERKEIRSMLRLMRDNFERGLYAGEEYQYWQKVNALKKKLELLNHIPESAIHRAARTLLNLHVTWEWATREERKMLVRTMIQEAGCDVGTKAIVWVKVNPDYEILFRLMGCLRLGAGRREWIAVPDAGESMEQIATEVEIPSPLSHNTFQPSRSTNNEDVPLKS